MKRLPREVYAWMRIVVYLTGFFVAIYGIRITRELFLGGAISPGMALALTIGSAILGLLIVFIGVQAKKLLPPAEDNTGTEVSERVYEGRGQTKRAIEKDVPREKSMPPAMDASQDEWFKWYDQVTGGSSVKPAPPVDENSPKDMWFHWYHYVIDVQGYNMTLRDLASVMGLSYGTVRKHHSDYQAQHGTKTAQN